MERVREYADSNAVITIVGNKTDLGLMRTVSAAEAAAYAEKNKCLYIETSALDGSNVNKAFDNLLEEIFHLKLPEFTTLVEQKQEAENATASKETGWCCG